jgi:hypothetical protein
MYDGCLGEGSGDALCEADDSLKRDRPCQLFTCNKFTAMTWPARVARRRHSRNRCKDLAFDGHELYALQGRRDDLSAVRI